MTQAHQTQQESSIFTRGCIAGLSGYIAFSYSPIMESGFLHPLPTLAAVLCAGNGIILTALGLKRIAAYLDYCASTIPLGHNKGTARFASKREIQSITQRYGWGAYWGISAKTGLWSKPKPLIIQYQSNAVTFGPAGAGKDVSLFYYS